VNIKTGEQAKGTSRSPSFPLGDFAALVHRPFETFRDWHDRGIQYFWVATHATVDVSDPILAQEILQTKDSTWGRDLSQLYILGKLEGESIVTRRYGNWMIDVDHAL
jgi:hypothetical protein